MATKYKYNENRKEWYTLVYDGTLTPSGEKHRKRITSKKSSKDLENKVNAFKASLEEKAVTNITLGEYAEKWLALYKANKEVNTQLMYKNALNYLKPLYNKRLVDITRSDLQFIINMNNDHPRTCKLIKQTFTQVLNNALYDNLISDMDFRKITTNISMPAYVKPVKSALDPAEREAVLSADLSGKDKAFLILLYYTGIRKSEALALEVSDFDFNNNTLSIDKAIITPSNVSELKPYPKSNNGIRVIPLCEPCIDVLKDYMVNCEGVIFKGQNNAYMTATEYRTMWRHIQKAVNEALGSDTHITAHKLRHNFCTLLCYQVPTISTKTIARILGDKEEMVLNVYSHIMEEKEDISGAINRAFDV